MPVSTVRGASRVSLLSFLFVASSLWAEPLSKSTEIDFYRDVPSRNLKGFAARSDGRLVAGPVLQELSGAAPADLLWCLSPTGDPAKWLVGSGPDGKIFELAVDSGKRTYSSREVVKLDEPHVFALLRLSDGSVLAGTSPNGALCLIRDGKLVSRIALPVDSIFDFLQPKSDGASSPGKLGHVLVATGNPGKIFRVDLTKFAASPVVAEKVTDTKRLAESGIELFGEVRDRNIRRIAQLSDGRIVAGSAPKGNIYSFAREGGAAVILQENRDGEVTDLLPSADGGLYATVTFSGGAGEARITPPKGSKDTPDTLAIISAAPDKFTGRSSLISFPSNGFPETLTARTGTALYRLVRHGELLVATGGEQGEMIGYNLRERLALTFAGSASSQLNGLAAIPGHSGKFLVMRNNAPGFAFLDFTHAAEREAETRRIDLGTPALLGALRFNRLRELTDQQLAIDWKISNGSDEVEGWSGWTPLKAADGGWTVPDQRGRYLKLRLKVPAAAPAGLQIDKATLYALPQNRRPILQDFNLLSSNFGLVPMPESPTPVIVSVGQLIQSNNNKEDDNKRRSSFLGSQIVPSPGSQVVIWTVNDPDGDNVRCTFSIRAEDSETWTDVALNTSDPYAQFDTSNLKDGLYFTRLIATEADPRPMAERLTTIFETDDLLVDHTKPEIVASSARRSGDRLILTVQGRDVLSLLEGIEAVFNNGLREETEHPIDGVRDGRQETFVLDLPFTRFESASAVEVTLYDGAGNTTAVRLTW
jgi:hypothetical protein